MIAVKIGALFFEFFLLLGIAALTRSIIGDSLYSLLAVLLTAATTFRLYFLAEFVSNLVALTFLMWALVCVVRFVKMEKSLWALGAVFLFVGAVFSHRSGIGFVLLLLAEFAAIYTLRRVAPNSKYKYLFLVTGTSLIPPLLSYQPFFALPT